MKEIILYHLIELTFQLKLFHNNSLSYKITKKIHFPIAIITKRCMI